MRRIRLVLAAASMAVLLVAFAAPAMAKDNGNTHNWGNDNDRGSSWNTNNWNNDWNNNSWNNDGWNTWNTNNWNNWWWNNNWEWED